MSDVLGDLRSDHLAGRRRGLASVCSAHPDVLAAAMHAALAGPGALLVEATAGQVNQYGGYTGMTPEAFVAGLRRLAAAGGFPPERLTVGADHLGPYVWRADPAEAAMARCEELIRRCVRAGFRKLHLDTGFGCADDPAPLVPPEQAAARAVRLCRAAEAAVAEGQARPFYVVGAEVPAPGGDLAGDEAPAVTPVADLVDALDRLRAGFRAAGLESAWERVVAVVVQPGVEFGDEHAAAYRSERAAALSAFHARLPGIMTFEIHSTDYQPAEALDRLTADHFTLLKLGPCLTHACHRAVLALERLEGELLAGRPGVERSGVADALEAAMLADPAHWQTHYRGGPDELRRLRLESLRDRARYYWGAPAVQSALGRLRRNLAGPLPLPRVERFFPGLDLENASPDAAALVRATVQAALRPYLEATS
jgi:D-tagatose-1,6-bisphosphate aldolase subunit GatZ/KbaZ